MARLPTKATVIGTVSAAAMVVPIVSTNFFAVLAAFGVFELCVGAYYPIISTMRTEAVSDIGGLCVT